MVNKDQIVKVNITDEMNMDYPNASQFMTVKSKKKSEFIMMAIEQCLMSHNISLQTSEQIASAVKLYKKSNIINIPVSSATSLSNVSLKKEYKKEEKKITRDKEKKEEKVLENNVQQNNNTEEQDDLSTENTQINIPGISQELLDSMGGLELL